MDRNEKLKYLRAFIVLAAGLVMMVCDFKTGQDLTTSLVHLLVVLMGFYVLADIVVWVIKKVLEMPTKEALEAEREALEQMENNESEESDSFEKEDEV